MLVENYLNLIPSSLLFSLFVDVHTFVKGTLSPSGDIIATISEESLSLSSPS